MNDTTTYTGLAGAAMAVISPWLNFLTTGAQLVGVLGGLVLLFYSIKHKRMLIKQLRQYEKDEKTL